MTPHEVDQAIKRGRGRRPAGEDTKSALLDAAREVFAEQGFDNATVRTIAARAGVDAAMVNHWFGGKQGLFNETVQLPAGFMEQVMRTIDSDPETLPENVVRGFLAAWDANAAAFPGIVRSVSSQDQMAAILRDFVGNTIFGRITQRSKMDHPELRSSLCAAQMVGIGMMRYVLKLEPVAAADVETLVNAIAPTIRRYLTGDID